MALGAAVGIKQVANGIYRCIAQNDNASDTATLRVNVMSKFHYNSVFKLS